jgi:diacylglycerol kinase family enzyme
VATNRSRILVLLNAKSGASNGQKDSQNPDAIARTFESLGVHADVRALDGPDIIPTARAALADSYDAIVAGGGDGTLSSIASVLVNTPTPLGVLPLGTLNHFAKDLKIPLDLPAAAQVIATGIVRPIDVAQVNDRVFINNSSIGLYPRLVAKRDRQMQRLGRGKWYSLFLAFISVFRKFRHIRVRLAVGDESLPRTTPFVFVGNNEYDINSFTLGSRRTLDRGQLCLYFANRTGRFGMFRLAFRALLGRLNQAKDFTAMCTKEVWIDSIKPTLRVSADGELLTLPTPLHYRILPKALNVIVPVESKDTP